MTKADAEKLFDILTDPDARFPPDFERACSDALLRKPQDPMADLMAMHDDAIARGFAAVWDRRNERASIIPATPETRAFMSRWRRKTQKADQ